MSEIMNFQPDDKIEYCPVGKWRDGCILKAVVIETIKSGPREGCLKIKLTEPNWKTRGAFKRIVRVDKVRLLMTTA